MSRVSNIIEDFIKSLLRESDDGMLEIKRNELADHFNCSPSQINYVLKTRFNSGNGYYVESRRGGGGYIKIVKVNINDNKYIENIINNTIGNSITKLGAYNIINSLIERKVISPREGIIMKAALGDRVLNLVPNFRNELRANILKDMILALLKNK